MSDVLDGYAAVVQSVLEERGRNCLLSFDADQEPEKAIALHTKTTQVAINIIRKLNSHSGTILILFLVGIVVLPLFNLLPVQGNMITYTVLFIATYCFYYMKPVFANIVTCIEQLESALERMDGIRTQAHESARINTLLCYFLQHLDSLIGEADCKYKQKYGEECTLSPYERAQILITVMAPADKESVE